MMDDGQFIHPCHCTEITADEYRRVAGMKPRNDRVEKFMRKKEELKALSDERIKKWPNTLKNLREIRIKNVKKRLEKEEEEKRKQDVIDAAFRAQRRREQLEKSNLQLLKPHIKELHFKALMEEIMKEREKQIIYKRKMDEAWKQKDKWWHELLMRDWKKGTTEDDRDEQLRRDKCLEVQRDQAKQLAHRRLIIQKEKDAKKAEGERLKKRAADDLAAAEEEARLKEIRRIEQNKEFQALNVALNAARAAEKAKLKQLDVQIAEYVANKERRDAAYKAERDRIQAEKNKHRDNMIAKLAADLLAARVDSETRLATAEQEQRIAEDMREQIFAARRKHNWDICDRSRQQQIKLKKMHDDMEAQDAKEKAAQVWQRVLEVQEMDEAEFAATLQNNKTLAGSQRKTAEDKKAAAKAEKQYQIDEFQTNWKKMAEDDEYIRNIKIQ
ncbi:hypothetical protein MPTK1_8g10880 [Marchantia polymorpha subsp. ruderalis]|uniref:Trichohyalin-plectin-homology domain-containing protein n=2 Tax=Marchantia polymorpha TaxID=3197 RepID=A0A2R6XMM7_MARPO|nr:hypothetical protein MARPO_0008s0133 [Marchantia polymorpha]BBN19461.1 hypothetical protein Mp_8g10880 [Marchantia polymorpha subsp. ruderalis]|eukprot:PTQ47368.1 hypothetical protein MARPO_0008s0133 [Marchantia polymorpha]